MKSSKTLLWFGKAALAGGVSIVLLSMMTIIYNFTGVHIENPTRATDYMWEPKQLKTTMVEGFSWFKMDKNGYNNVFLQDNDIDILLMGSSHMEAVQVSKYENTGYLLNNYLKEQQVYNIGISGHAIYNCVDNLENAVNTYKPKRYVIIETSTVELEIDSMEMVLNGTYPHIVSYDDGLIYTIQKNIPAIKALYKQVEEWKTSQAKVTDFPKERIQDYTEHSYTDILKDFLSKAADSVKNKGVKLIIFYHPDTMIDEAGNMINTTDSTALEAFQTTCDMNGIMFIDMTETFQRLYAKEHILAHGFSNTAIGEGHLNAAGHKAVSKKIASAIQNDCAVQEENKDVFK